MLYQHPKLCQALTNVERGRMDSRLRINDYALRKVKIGATVARQATLWLDGRAQIFNKSLNVLSFTPQIVG
jgi:hypothetical protein